MAVRIKDVADYCGLSPGAVSQVIRNTNHRIPEKTRQKVLAAIEKLSYRPNNLSVGLRKKHNNLLSLIIPWDNPELMDMVEQEASRHGLKVMVNFTTSPDTSREVESLDQALDWHVAGIVWAPYADLENYPERLIKRIRNSGTKLVFLQRRLPELPGVMIEFDYRQGIEAAVNHAVDCGYSQAVLVQNAAPFELRSRRKSFFQAAGEARHLPMVSRHFEETNEALYDAMRQMLLTDKSQPSTIYFCDSDRLALALLDSARSLGLEIPGQLGIITIGDHLLLGHIRLSQVTFPKLSSLRMDYGTQGRLAVEFISTMIADSTTPEDIMLPVPLCINDSTRSVETPCSVMS